MSSPNASAAWLASPPDVRGQLAGDEEGPAVGAPAGEPALTGAAGHVDQEVQPDLPREVTMFDGTFEQAVTQGLIEKPPLMAWNA